MQQEPIPKRITTAAAKIALLSAATGLAGWTAHSLGLASDSMAVIAACTFAAVIFTTLFFCTHRIAIALLGIAVLIGSRAITLKAMLVATELDIIFFLIGIMVMVGALKDLGFMTWIIQGILNRKQMTGLSFTGTLCALAALLSAVIGEVSAIIIVLALVFQVCDTLRVKATPFVLIAVLSTNIGSAATMLGNPVGIYIGNKAGLTFNQFLLGATPISIVSLLATLSIAVCWYRREIASLNTRIEEYRQAQRGLGPLFKLPHKHGIFVLCATLLFIAFHHQLENIFGLTGSENKNAFLIITPLVIAALLMLYRPHRARHYLEKEVEWPTLLFFMLLFAIASGLKEQGVTHNLALKLSGLTNGSPQMMLPFVLAISAVGSALMDNIVFVAAFTPIVQSLVERSAECSILWWALLFGACFGGNLTVVGSTANIIAMGQLERHGQKQVRFFEWLKIGMLVTIVTTAIAWAGLAWFPPPKPCCQAITEAPCEAPAVIPLAHSNAR